MNSELYDNMASTIENASDYCRLSSYNLEVTEMFTVQLSALASCIEEYQNMLNPTDLVNTLVSIATANLAKAQAEYAALVAKQAEILSALNNKLSQLESELRSKLPNGGQGIDLGQYCSTQEQW